MRLRLAVGSIAALLLTGGLCWAQNQNRRLDWHVVRGVVVDEKGSPIERAAVYLQDVPAHRLKIRQTGRKGQFRFNAIRLGVDHYVYAEEQGDTSEKVAIPSSETRREIVVKLKVQHKKSN
jgi:hypothetical protein